MLTRRLSFPVLCSLLLAGTAAAQWPGPLSPAIPQADGYVVIPNAALPPDKNHVYKAIFDATKSGKTPGDLLPAVNNAGSELNAFRVTGVPDDNVKFAIVFHGGALDGILDDEHYKAKHGVANPNLKVLSELKKAGVELFVCGQNLAGDKIDPKSIAPELAVASDALLVLMEYQARGYALLSQ